MIARMPERAVKKWDLNNFKKIYIYIYIYILKGILLLAFCNFCVSYIQLNPSKEQS